MVAQISVPAIAPSIRVDELKIFKEWVNYMKNTAKCAILLSIILQGCTGMNVASISERSAKGKDVNQVVAELENRGMICGKEFLEKAVDSATVFGTVVCSTKEIALFCPESYSIYISFYPETRKVVSLNKFSRTNCF